MWVATYRPSAETDVYAIALGRTLALAQNFEENCKYVAMIVGLATGIESGDVDVFGDTAWNAVVDKVKKQNLFSNIGGLRATETELRMLQAGRVSRNHIAHRAARDLLIPNHFLSSWPEPLDELKAHAKAIAEADNIVASWSYEMQEKQPAPSVQKQIYVEKVLTWIFEERS